MGPAGAAGQVPNGQCGQAASGQSAGCLNQEPEDEDDDEVAAAWTNLIQHTAKVLDGSSDVQEGAVDLRKKKNITLTALNYGEYEQVITCEESPCLIGRFARMMGFLDKDGRVSNEHCYLIYKDGNWSVRDKHSTNGTFLNGEDIGLNGERVLSDGDELKLGHSADSMAFRVKIG